MDSGANVNAIDPHTVNKLKLPWKTKNDPYPIRNLEGGHLTYDGGLITREIDHLKVFVGTRRQHVNLDIIPTPGYDLMLGYPWLHRYNPRDIDWRTGQIHHMEEHSDDESTDSETDDEQRSQTSTEATSEVRREKTTETRPPPKGV
jgi:hypothetical protein